MPESATNKSLPFWLLTIAVILGLTAPFLVRDGMFLDGVLYSTISHNLSRGIGSFWYPVFSPSILVGHTTFHEHPPLGFAIQACIYRLIGHSLYAERLYVFITLIISASLIAVIWRSIHRDTKVKAMSWLPVLIWILIPVCSWSYRNNMLENTMSIFVLAAVWILYENMERDQPSYGRYILAGIFIFIASFTKGAPGMFPFAFPVFYGICLRRHSLKHVFFATVILILTVISIYAIILSFPAARDSLQIYFFDRLLGRVRSISNVGSHFSLIPILLNELIIPMIFAVLALIAFYYQKTSIRQEAHLPKVALFVLLGLSGSLPLMLVLMQRSYYLVTVFPYFAIATALFISSAVARLSDYISSHQIWSRSISGVAITGIISVMTICLFIKGTPSRDSDILHDIYAVGSHVPRRTVVSASQSLKGQFAVQIYLMRYFDISYSNPGDHIYYYFVAKNEAPGVPNAEKEDWDLRTLDVYAAKE